MSLITFLTDVYLSLKGTIIPNHGYTVYDDIGSTDVTALLCHTNKRSVPIQGGNWFSPEGTRVSHEINVPGFTRNRGEMLVRLKKSSSETPEQGIFKCQVQDANNVPRDVFVGIYKSGKGI